MQKAKKKDEKANLLEFWKDAVAQYVRKKREETGKGQKELGPSRRTISDIENRAVNFTLGSLLEVLEAVGGDISEAFASRVPKDFPASHRLIHEQLQAILDAAKSGDERAVRRADYIIGNIEVFYEGLDRDRTRR